ncbi:MAG: hydrolase, partial [Myxococcota bacterium]
MAYERAMPIVESRFRPAWWLPGPHLQTLGPVLARPTPRLEFDWERIELDDGDFIDLAWARPRAGRPDAPTLTILPGLGGNYLSKYARGLALDALARGWSAGILHFRGTSRETNRLAKTYHAGLTSDPRQVLEHVRRTRPSAPIGAVGLSLGGSVLLNLLAEDGAGSPITAAAAASVPLDLAACARRIQRGFSRVYDRHLARELTSRLMARRPLVEKRLGPVDPRRLTSVESFDELVTAPLHGFVDAADYYQRCSSGPRLGALKTPTIIVQALD